MPNELPVHVSFAQPLFMREHLAGDLQRVHKTILSRDNLAASMHLAAQDAHAAGFQPTQEVSDELMPVYNAVITDGRYVKLFGTDPEAAASKLGFHLSDAAVAAVKTASAFRGAAGISGADDGTVYVVCVAVIVVLCARPSAGEEVVVNARGQIRL